MNKRTIILAVIFMALVAIYTFVNCGGTASTSNNNDDDGSISSAPQFDNISDLPSADTQVVSAATAASLSALTKYAATTGTPFNADDPSFTSQAACETFNQTKWALNQAIQGSTIMCYVQTTFDAIAADDTHPAHDVDIYDGEWHNFHLTGGSEEFEAPDYFRLKVSTDSEGYISGFTMYSCRDGEQDMYLNQTIDTETGEFSMENIGAHEDAEGQGIEQSSVTGYVNGLGYFEGTKDLTIDFTGTWQGSTNSGHIEFTQTETTGTINGAMSGEYSEGDDSWTWEQLAYSYYEILDGNSGSGYNVGLLALGDGAASYNVSGTDSEYGAWEHDGVESWDGDTTHTEDSNDYTETAEAGTLLSVSDIDTPAFDGDSEIDCSELEDGAIDIDFSELDINPESVCDQLDHDHIDCWSEE